MPALQSDPSPTPERVNAANQSQGPPRLLGKADVAKLLATSLKEEKATDLKLNGIAKRKINKKALARGRAKPPRKPTPEELALMTAPMPFV